jgi:hypothetical protein
MNGAFVRGSEYFENRTTPSATTNIASSSKSWKLIIASFSVLENAENFAKSNSSYSIFKAPGENLYRVVYNSYNKLSEAKSDIQIIRNQYPDAWLVRS